MSTTPISLRPSDAVAGGLIDDIDAIITDAKFMMYDYNGTVDPAVPALGIELETKDGGKYEEYLSAGDAKYFVPSGDGKTLTKVGDKDHLTNSCKLMVFMGELVNAGFPEDKLGAGDISVLKGLNAHFQRKADKARAGLVRTGKNADRQQTTLVVTKIHAMPGEKAAASTPNKPVAGAPTTASKPAASAPVNGISDDLAMNLVIELLGETNPIPKNKISQLAFKKCNAAEKGSEYKTNATALTQRVFKDELLQMGAANRLWEFDGTTVKLPA